MVSRRRLLSYLGIGGAGSIAGAFTGGAQQHQAQPTPGLSMPGDEHQPPPSQAPQPVDAHASRGFVPVQTPNGRTLPWKWVNGAKEFHLIAEELEHEFAPGCKAKCWGYNGSTPGST